MQLKEFKLSEPNKDASFRIDQEFVDQYKAKPVNWGPLGEFTYLRTYSRKKEDGSKEQWYETVQRVVDGAFTIQKKHCLNLHLKWDQRKATKSAKIMFDKIFNFKFLPPGRGLWVMGTKFVEDKGSAALNNCAFISTKDISVRGSFAFGWTMDALMLGVGVGFDALGADQITIKEPKKTEQSVHIIPDSREGWVASLNIVLDAFFHGKELPQMDYSSIRAYGEPIKGFGGVASGPEPLRVLHESVANLLTKRIGEKITSVDIVDVMNMIGKCVIAGNVRRCLPVDSMVHTKSGMVRIQNVSIGTEVLTHDGYKKVTNHFIQGEQETIKIRTADGFFESTPNHRMAVLNGVDSFVWKEAKDLVNGDRLVTTHQPLNGTLSTLPEYSHQYKESDRTGIQITIPPLDPDIAWFLGQLHANGYVYKRTHTQDSSSVLSLVVALDKKAIAEKFVDQAMRFSEDLNPSLKKRKGENSYIVKIHSDQLVTYLIDNFKTPNTPIHIPECIWSADQSVKLAYVAGVMDGDGCVKTRPIQVVSSVYENFVYDLQNLLYSCGVGSRVDYSSVNSIARLSRGWQPLYALNLINGNAHEILGGCPQLINKLQEKTRYNRTNSYPVEWLKEVIPVKYRTESGYHSNSFMTHERVSKYTSTPKLIPVEVRGIEPGRYVETYDIEVDDNHNFFCNGYLTHNSAEIAIGNWQDKDYTSMKDYNLFPEELMSHRWASNNSVFAEVGKTDYVKFIDNIAVNGEPGLIWLENMQKYSRTIDPPDWKDKAVAGTNPCQPSWAKILTHEGIRELKDISIGDKIWSKEGWTTVVNKWSTGIKKVYKYETNSNIFYGTENHQVISDGLKVEVGEATSIDSLSGMYISGADIDVQDVMDGLVIGDGSQHKASNQQILLYIGENDSDYFDSEIKELIVKKWGQVNKATYEVITTITPDELPKTYERGVPKRYFENHNKVKGFLRGLYSANGSVVNNRITLKTSSKQIVEDVQLMLSSIGIQSYYTTNKSKDVTFSNGTYTCKESYDINISGDRQKFVQTIGFIQQYKNDKIREVENSNTKKTYDIKSTTFISEEEVFDITVDNSSHTYWTQGCDVSNCGEQSLESGELCCLVETFPSLHDSFDEYKETLKYAYMYAKSVTLLPTHWPETNAILLKNRRIGLSQSGIVDAFVKHGRHTMLQTWCDKGFGFVQELDELYSDWLCVPRSKKTTTVKPSGSVSLLAGVSPGIHYPHSEYYIRRIRVDSDDPLVQIMKNAGYYVCYDVYGSTKEEKEKTSVVHFPVHESNFSKRKEDVSIWEQVKNTVDYQKYWADNNVSVTVTFKKDEANDILGVLEAFESELKSISFLPISEHGYQLAPYEEITKEKFEEMVEAITPLDYSSLFLPAAKGSKFCDGDTCEI